MKVIKYSEIYNNLTVDSTLYTADNNYITSDQTIILVVTGQNIVFVPRKSINKIDDTYDHILVKVVNEFTNKSFEPEFNIILDNEGYYNLVFIDAIFDQFETRYSINILDTNTNQSIYQGKMIYTEKSIQDYRYTIMLDNNTKMKLNG